MPDEVLEQYRNDPELGPIVSNLQEQDLPSVLKGYHSLKGHLGKAVFVKDAKNPEEVKAAQARAYELGIFPKPNVPESPDKYEITRPQNMPESAWKDEIVNEFRILAHKHGLTQEAIKELLAFDAKRFNGVESDYQIDHDALQKGVEEEWQKVGKSYEEVVELGARGMKAAGLSDPELDALEKYTKGDPRLASALAKIGLAHEADSGILGTPIPRQDSENAKAEGLDIMNNQQNPKWKLYWGGDKATVEYVNALFAKAHPGTTEL